MVTGWIFKYTAQSFSGALSALEGVEAFDANFGATAAGKLPPEAAAAVGDAGMALEQLGFKRDHVNQVLQELAESLPAEELTSENLLRRALLALNRV